MSAGARSAPALPGSAPERRPVAAWDTSSLVAFWSRGLGRPSRSSLVCCSSGHWCGPGKSQGSGLVAQFGPAVCLRQVQRCLCI